MKQTLHRLFCLLLCAVMVAGMIPAAAAAAQSEESAAALADSYMVTVQEDGTRTYTPTTFEKEQIVSVPKTENESKLSFPAMNAIGTDEWGSTTFETFGDLKELAAGAYAEYTQVDYIGEEELVISENLTIPENLVIANWTDYATVIPKGVTVTAEGQILASHIRVQGTLNLNSHMYASNTLTVTGTVIAIGSITLEADTIVTGIENITFTGEYDAAFHVQYYPTTLAKVREALTSAKNKPAYRHEIYYDPINDITLGSNLTVPDNAFLRIRNYNDISVTVNSGITMTVNGSLTFDCPLVIMGQLVNNGYINIYGDSMKFASTGSYSAKPEALLYIETDDTDASLTDILTGLDPDNLEVQEYIYAMGHGWDIRDLSALPRLAAPTNLTWNKAERWYYNESTGEYDPKVETYYGAIRFKPGTVVGSDTDATWFRITLYKDGAFLYTTQLCYSNAYLKEIDYVYEYLNYQIDLETGDYHFTVQAVSETSDYASSTVATSGKWSYTKPSGSGWRYARPTNTRWEDGPMATWDRPIPDHYSSKIEFFWAPTADAEPTSIYFYWDENMIGYEIDSWLFENWGPGYYYFKVRTISNNIVKKYHSAWTELSPVYHYTGKNKPVAPTVKSSIDTVTGKPVLTWERSPLANKYRVYRATSKDGEYKSIGVMEYDYTMWSYTFTDTTAKPGTNYYYKVRAYSYTGVTSSLSNAVSRMCDLAQPIVSITGNASTGKPVVKWETVDGAAKYYIYRATSKNGEYKHVKTAVTARSYEDADAKAGTNYYYKVKAIHTKEGANSVYSRIVNRVCDLKRPVVTITHSTAGNPYLKWSKISGAEKYFIYRATSKSGDYTRIGSTTELKYVDKNVTEGKTYYYKVKAIHAKEAANSAASAIDYIKAK